MELENHERQLNGGSGDLPCRLIERPIEEIRAHDSYAKHGLFVSASKLSQLIAAGDAVLTQPIIVTRTRTIIDGYGRWELAKRWSRRKILCLEYDLSDEEALRWLIGTHLPSKGMNGFCRSQLASDLEPVLRDAARNNQRIGGQMKGSSTLTEAQTIDSRSELAAIAGVSSGQFSKAKRVAQFAPATIREAVQSGEISVHKAWQSSHLSESAQLENLEESRGRKGTSQASCRLIRKHVARMRPTKLVVPTLRDLLSPMIPHRVELFKSILVSELDVPGRIAYFTKEALQMLMAEGAPG